MVLTDLCHYLDAYLDIARVPDWPRAVNGLQVESPKPVRSICVAVDGCAQTIQQTIRLGADLLIVHHGLFWSQHAPVTGTYYKRLAPLIKNDVALYSCHTPLDAHPEVGNNHVMARSLGMEPASLFAEYQGVPLGVLAECDLDRDELHARIRQLTRADTHAMMFGPLRSHRVGVVTGAAGDWIGAAHAAGADTFITGEGAHHTYFDAEELGINVIYAGHYATETFGVKALAAHIETRFGIPWQFIDHPTGL